MVHFSVDKDYQLGGGNLDSGYNSNPFSNTSFSIYKPVGSYYPPDTVDNLQYTGAALEQMATKSCRLTLSRNPLSTGTWDKTSNTKYDFSVHICLSTDNPYWSAGTKFNCVVTNYDSSNGELTFDATSNTSGSSCIFAVIVRSGSGSGETISTIRSTSTYVINRPVATITSSAGGISTRLFNGYTYTCIRNSGTLSFSTTTICDVLLVGGGGGGSNTAGGGGGAGGIVYIQNATINNGTYSVTVGGGGLGSSSDGNDGEAGGNTVAFGVKVFGGGAGVHGTNPTSRTLAQIAADTERGSHNYGGSGGGGGYGTNSVGGLKLIPSGPQNIGGSLSSYGNAGGTTAGSSFVGNGYYASGGGGAGGQGNTTSSSGGGAGGIGLNTWSDFLAACSIGERDSSGVFWIGGGGGGSGNDLTGAIKSGSGGKGGGGKGGFANAATSNGFNGTSLPGLDYSGGGGGGGGTVVLANIYDGRASRGGTGVIIIKQGYNGGAQTIISGPTDISGLQFWLDSNDPNGNGIIPSANSQITNLIDKSGNSRMASALSTKAIFIQAGAVKGIPTTLGCLYFNNTGYKLTYTNFPQSYTIFSVFKASRGLTTASGPMTPHVSQSCYVLSGPTDCVLYFGMMNDLFQAGVGIGSGQGWLSGGVAPSTPETYIRDQWVVATITYDSATKITSRFLNGIVLSTTNDTTQQNNGSVWNDLYIGQPFASGTDYRFEGYIGEILIYSSVLSSVNRKQVDAWLCNKYGFGITI